MKAQPDPRAQTVEVVSLLKRAVEIDRQFAMAYTYLGRSYASLGSQNLERRI